MIDGPPNPRQGVRVRPSAEHAIALIRRFGSPLYTYDLQHIERTVQAFVAAIPYAPLDVHYAVVCNKNPAIISRLYELGTGVHANTPGDAYAALSAGVPAQRIVYSGTNLDASDMAFVLDQGIRSNVDSLDQLNDLVTRAPGRDVGLRILIDPPRRGSRIGLAIHELGTAIGMAAAMGSRIVGLHMYAGTNTRRFERFISCVDWLIDAADRVPDLQYLDVGGGFGLTYSDRQDPLDLAAVGGGMAERMRALSTRRRRPIKLIVEPGRILVGAAGTLFVTVVSIKERGGRRFVGVDTTIGNIVVPSVYHTQHRIEAVMPRGPSLDVPTDVCGNTTHSRDFLGRDLRLPALEPGDVLALRDVGAYGYAMSSHFLNRPRPPEVVLDGNLEILTTRRETFADLLATVQPR